MQKHEPVLRFLIDPISITYMLQPNLGLENLQIFVQSITYILQPNLGLENLQFFRANI